MIFEATALWHSLQHLKHFLTRGIQPPSPSSLEATPDGRTPQPLPYYLGLLQACPVSPRLPAPGGNAGWPGRLSY